MAIRDLIQNFWRFLLLSYHYYANHYRTMHRSTCADTKCIWHATCFGSKSDLQTQNGNITSEWHLIRYA